MIFYSLLVVLLLMCWRIGSAESLYNIYLVEECIIL